ncbi:tetratricopeptide repeat protein [Achromobacter denitrificans]|uniref:tetratricopeptide repeat protein n=1 Tax=Achromobacter denitrificans TaxID=32002 RepID=UPI000E1FCFCA|nr:tetratricopeptide repeat protein [Achromobacter denitrificans]QKH41698.1 sel1 repeat family protein [Achromobacter denitrificans]QKH51159.1 sel1 repeat family protein [Achromobacter denitrificans]
MFSSLPKPQLPLQALAALALLALSPQMAHAAPTETRPQWLDSAIWYDQDPGRWSAAEVRQWLRDAPQGDTTTQYRAAVALEAGQHVPQDLAQARRWYEAAARGGNAAAQASLARMLQAGWGGRQDKRAARKWNELAADQGHRRALFNQAAQLQREAGPQGDMPAAALSLYRRAAELGLPQSAAVLAEFYRDDRGARDLPEAWRWLGQAADDGYAPTLYDLDNWCNARPEWDGCEAKAIHALTDAAKLGYPPAQGRLGLRYLDFTFQQIRWTPELWLKLNARYPDDPALLKDREAGARWVTLAAANGDVLALYNIGIILQREAAKGASGKSAYEPTTMAAVRACFAAAAQRGMGAAMLAMVETYEAEDAREQYTRQEREELMHYWVRQADAAGMLDRRRIGPMWSGWNYAHPRRSIAPPSDEALRRGMAPAAACALKPLSEADRAPG